MRRGLMAAAVRLLLLTGLGCALAGCSWRAWYEGLRERQRQECYRESGPGAIQGCLDRVNATSYDDYQRQRERRQAATP